jgi:hypothetical protein
MASSEAILVCDAFNFIIIQSPDGFAVEAWAESAVERNVSRFKNE